MRTDLPPVLAATTIERKGTFVVISYLLCLYLYSGMFVGFLIGHIRH